jgi:hypothetical protein
MNMNTLFENTLLKMGIGLQTMSAPKVPSMLKNLFKSQTPLEKLNQERAAMGYDPLTQSEWLASAGGVSASVAAATIEFDDDDMFGDGGMLLDDTRYDPMYSSWSSNIYCDD